MGKDKQQTYIEKVREETAQYVQGLLDHIDRLQRNVAFLELERARVAEERLRFQEQLVETRDQLQRSTADYEKLQRQMYDIEAQNQRFADRYVEVEAQNSNLASLYVASYRLHCTLDRDEVVQGIVEIVINLIGSEEIAVYEVDDAGKTLELVGSFGIDEKRYREIPVGEGIIGTTFETGRLHIAGAALSDARPGALDQNLTACIPLTTGGLKVGVLAVFRLLEQKPALESLDYELLDLLGTHAATALRATRLHAEAEQKRAAG